MQHTRQQIVDYLQANRMASAIELSRALLVTPANIRHHLGILKASDVVEVVGQAPARGRGRPTNLYRLTENALKHNLAGLASALLKTLLADQSARELVLAETAVNFLGEYHSAANMHARLNQLVEKLNQLKYQAAWEASPGGPRIILRNCPYARLLPDHPELCQLDAALLVEMLKHPVLQSAKLKRSLDGSPHCAFILRQAK